jgi:hypothetical protein
VLVPMGLFYFYFFLHEFTRYILPQHTYSFIFFKLFDIHELVESRNCPSAQDPSQATATLWLHNFRSMQVRFMYRNQKNAYTRVVFPHQWLALLTTEEYLLFNNAIYYIPWKKVIYHILLHRCNHKVSWSYLRTLLLMATAYTWPTDRLDHY